MLTKKDTVIILKSINYSEADKILTVFGRNRGKFSIIAYGIRKIKSKNRGNLQTLCLSEISYSEGKSLAILKESNLIHTIDFKQADVQNIHRILFLLNTFLPEDTPEPEIFDTAVRLIGSRFADEKIDKFRLYFLEKAGFIPSYKNCSNCAKSEDISHINPNSFELMCSGCYNDSTDPDHKLHSKFKSISDIKKSVGLSQLIDKFIENIL
ncbi:DNA repair protein RecO [Candidatus Dojkabacteria bacterium]|nr:DNA repair protein RecO [Candidatus Dojkabacteria bacterium]